MHCCVLFASPRGKENLHRSCKHGGMRFLGLYGERHRSYAEPFMDEEKRGRTRAFAQHIMEQL